MLTALATLTRPQPDAPHILLWILGTAPFLLAAAAEITFLRFVLRRFLRHNPAPALWATTHHHHEGHPTLRTRILGGLGAAVGTGLILVIEQPEIHAYLQVSLVPAAVILSTGGSYLHDLISHSLQPSLKFAKPVTTDNKRRVPALIGRFRWPS